MHGRNSSQSRATSAGFFSVSRFSSGAFPKLCHLKRIYTRLMLHNSIQMTGVSVIQYYAPTIFQSIGIDTSTTLGLQSGNSVIALIGEALCVWFIDRLGRRGPFVWGNALSGLTFVIGTILIAIFPAETNNHNASRAFVSMTWLFNLVFSSCLGPLSWAIPVEMFNSATRAKATAITSSAAWISNCTRYFSFLPLFYELTVMPCCSHDRPSISHCF